MRSCKDTPFKTKIYEIETPFKTKPFENHTLSGRTSPLGPYKEVPPPGDQVYDTSCCSRGKAFARSESQAHFTLNLLPVQP